MSGPFTPGPWDWVGDDEIEQRYPPHRSVAEVVSLPKSADPDRKEQNANARLIAAAPELYDGCNAMLGLVQLILGRDDLSSELREVLTTNHRIAEAEAATAKARGECRDEGDVL
jgi:hypothetical protein